MATVDSDPTSVSDDAPSARRSRPRWGLLLTLLVFLGVILLLRAFVGQIFVIPSASMEPTLNPGDRVLVAKLGYSPAKMQRGDIVVFDGTGSFIPYSTPGVVERITNMFGIDHSHRYFVKRIIGLPGDHIQCCTAQGQLSINGNVTDETAYIGTKMAASDETFNVIVPPGSLWMMGDNRRYSADSRAHMGDPGGGFVPQSRVVGRVIAVIWPPHALHTIRPGVPR